ncbi:MlaD family protein [Gordonia malaquae]|uniref:MlaD family protein n=1 Tax=Gordonia malaquae TaxID=410332 RepID=UPI0030EC9C38
MTTQTRSPREASQRTIRVRGFVAVFVITCLGLLLANYAKGGFDDTFRVTVNADRVGSGLVTGADVKVNGYAIGRVSEIETVGFGRQRIVLDLDPSQVGHLTDRVRARFASSNMFGSTGIELINVGGGSPLKSGATLSIGADTTQITVTDAFSRASRLVKALSDDETLDLLQFFADQSRGFGVTLTGFVETARMLRDNQIGSVRKYMRTAADMSAGASKLTPLIVGGVVDVVREAEYFGHQVNRDRVNRAIGGLNDVLLRRGGDALASASPDLVKVVSVLMDVVVPVAYSLGTLAPTYNRIPELIQNIRGAFPDVEGRPQLQLELVAATYPQVAMSLQTRGRG